MAVGQKNILRPAELESAAAGIERKAGRIDPHPGLVAGSRPTLEAKISETQLDRAHRSGGAPKGALFKDSQISRYSQRLSGLSRVATLSQSGSISQSAAATEDSRELPSCGVKQKP